jgi:hypothetical protein
MVSYRTADASNAVRRYTAADFGGVFISSIYANRDANGYAADTDS